MDEDSKDNSEEIKVEEIKNEEIKEEKIETKSNKIDVDKIMEKQIILKVYQLIILGLLIIVLILGSNFFTNLTNIESEEEYYYENAYSGESEGKDVKILLQEIESNSDKIFSNIKYDIYYSDESSFYFSNRKYYADHLMKPKNYVEKINDIISIIDDTHMYFVAFSEKNKKNVCTINIFFNSKENPFVDEASGINDFNNLDDNTYEDDMNPIDTYETNNSEIYNFESNAYEIDSYNESYKYRRFATINEYLNNEFNCYDYEYLLELLAEHGNINNTQMFYTVNILKDYSVEKNIESQVIEKIFFSDILNYKNNIENLKKYSINENIYRVVSIDETTMNIYIDVYSTGVEKNFSQNDIIYTNEYLSGKNVIKIIDAVVKASENGEVFQIYYYDKNSYDKSINIYEVTKIIKLINPDKYTEEVEKLKAKINLHHIYDIGVDAGEDHILSISEIILEE